MTYRYSFPIAIQRGRPDGDDKRSECIASEKPMDELKCNLVNTGEMCRDKEKEDAGK